MRIQKREKECFIMSASPGCQPIGSSHPESTTCELKHSWKNFPLNDSLTCSLESHLSLKQYTLHTHINMYDTKLGKEIHLWK